MKKIIFFILLVTTAVFVNAQEKRTERKSAYPDYNVVTSSETVETPTLGYTPYLRDDNEIYVKLKNGIEICITCVDQGGIGNDGLSAYQIAVNEGFVGTVTEWLASLKGEIGPQGIQGVAGNDGQDGDGFTGGSYSAGTGIVTFTSDDGLGFATGDLRGADGADGATGETGPQGIQGVQGVAGNDGNNGIDGDNGDSAYEVAVNEGFIGDETAWLASLVGADGADGSDGAQGIQGVKGDTGDTGPAGADGSDGATGPQGIQGVAGVDGSDGADGQGVPTGGTTGQVLAKIDNTNFNTEWVNPVTGGGGLSNPLTTDLDFDGNDIIDIHNIYLTGSGIDARYGNNEVEFDRVDGASYIRKNNGGTLFIQSDNLSDVITTRMAINSGDDGIGFFTDLDLNNNKITNLLNPSDPTDPVTLQYYNANLPTDTNTQLSDSEVKTAIDNEYPNLDTDDTDDFNGVFSSLSSIPSGLSDGDDDTISDGSETIINEGTNITITGTGTSGSPYVINASGGGSTDISPVAFSTFDGWDSSTKIANAGRVVVADGIVYLFEDDFENGTSVWNADGELNAGGTTLANTSIEVDGRATSGGSVLRMRADDTTVGSFAQTNNFRYDTFETADDIVVNFSIYLPQVIDLEDNFNSFHNFWQIKGYDLDPQTRNDPFWIISIDNRSGKGNGNPNYLTLSYLGQFWPEFSTSQYEVPEILITNIEVDTWHEVTIRFKKDTVNGEIQIYQNGILTHNVQNVRTDCTNLTDIDAMQMSINNYSEGASSKTEAGISTGLGYSDILVEDFNFKEYTGDGSEIVYPVTTEAQVLENLIAENAGKYGNPTDDLTGLNTVGTVTLIADNTDPVDGEYNIKATADAVSFGTRIAEDIFSLDPAKEYVFSGYARTNAPNNRLSIAAEYLDDPSDIIINISNDEEWHYFEEVVNTDGTSLQIRYQIMFSTTGASIGDYLELDRLVFGEKIN